MRQAFAQAPARASPGAAYPARVLARRNRRALSSLVVRASLPAEDESVPSTSSSSLQPSAAAKRAHALQAKPRVGAEYGEGFVQFRFGGEPGRLDVDTLNERLKHMGALRLRHTQKPDEAFGMVFNFDTVVADTSNAYLEAWRQLAQAKGLPLSQHANLRAQHTCPERIIMDVLGWTNSMKEARGLAYDLSEAYGKQLEQLAVPQSGTREWLNALTNFNVPCALVSSLDKATVRRALERMHLHDHFQVMVTAEDDMESMAQRLLSAALQLQRPPNLCVAFDGTPEGVTAAHNCTMKAVAVARSYPVYKLRSADVTCTNLAELTVYNVRRLFANAGDEFMDLRTQQDGDKPKHRRRVTSAMLPT